MGLVNGKWVVANGDYLWGIANQVYKNGYRWKEIANANGISQSRPIIFPNQVLVLPGITSGVASSGESYTPIWQNGESNNSVKIGWFCLTAGSNRNMEALWAWNGTPKFWVKWEEYDINNNKWVIAENKCYETTTGEIPQSQQTATDNAVKIRLSVRPVKDTDGNFQDNTEWAIVEYDFRNNPPGLSPTPSTEFSSITNTLTIRIEGINDDINANSIEIVIYQNDTIKYATVQVPINIETGFATYICQVKSGFTYKVRCRAVRNKNIYGPWTEFSELIISVPDAPSKITTLRPEVISNSFNPNKVYGIFAEWPEVKTAKTYELQWTTNLAFFNNPSSNVSSQTTEEGAGPRLLITGIELGNEYFFRVRSINDSGHSTGWSSISSVKLGTKPSAPTTWSNTLSSILGEDLNLYWNFNSTDGSIEDVANLYITIIKPNDSDNPIIKNLTIENDRPEEDRQKTNVYKINSKDDDWSFLVDGCIIKWKVRTAGITDEYSDWSIEREINVYSMPELVLDLKNKVNESVDEINSFPFYISTLAKPETQTPISYYIEIVSNDYYETVDNTNRPIVVNNGDKIFQNFYDPEDSSLEFILEMLPNMVNLKNSINYTINCTVSMNSGLIATSSINFTAFFNDIFYDVYGDISINMDTLEATIHPYCMEFYEPHHLAYLLDGDDTKLLDGDEIPLIINSDEVYTDVRLVKNCTLSVYRREYDGTYTEIATNIPNEENTYVIDPHPTLDYARYRIIARSNDTGAIVYSDVPAVKVGEPSVVLQWGEQWEQFETGDNGEGSETPPWSGSMIKIPYNIDVSESNDIDVSLIEYVGRKHPVSYYGTQVGEQSTWNVEIPKDDKETLFALRRLKIWMGDVYIREPSGTGYWANVSVSYSLKHLGVTIPVTFNIKRVEGGI